MTAITAPTGRSHLFLALLVAAGMVLAVGTALGFQYIGGYIPCKLCLEQRMPYYVGIPVMLLAALSAALRLPGVVTRGLLLVGGLLMLYGAYLGVYHSGVEWGWWAGPTDCQAVDLPAAGSGSGGILDQIDKVIPPSCTVAAGRFLGLSFAGWNVIASVVTAAIALTAVFRRQ